MRYKDKSEICSKDTCILHRGKGEFHFTKNDYEFKLDEVVGKIILPDRQINFNDASKISIEIFASDTNIGYEITYKKFKRKFIKDLEFKTRI